MLFYQNLLGLHLHVCCGVALDLDVFIHGCGALNQVTHKHLVIIALEKASSDK